MIPIENYIQVYENILDNNVCENIIREAREEDFMSAEITDGVKDKEVRNCYRKRLNNKYDKDIYNAIEVILNKYSQTFPHFSTGLSTEDTGYEHLLYKGKEEGYYKEHVDHFDLYPRVLSCSLILNDNYDGGDFAFFNEEYKVEKKKGSAVVFPSNFCFPHAILPVANGNRHAIITWIH